MFFIFFVFFPKRLTHILSKLILIFFPFLCLPFLFFFSFFFHVFSWHPNLKKFHTQKKTFKPVPLPSKSQTFLSLPKLSQLFQPPWPASSTHRHYRHHHNWRWFSSFLSLNDLLSLSHDSLKLRPKWFKLSLTHRSLSLHPRLVSLSLSSLYLLAQWCRSWWRYVFQQWVYGLWKPNSLSLNPWTKTQTFSL